MFFCFSFSLKTDATWRRDSENKHTFYQISQHTASPPLPSLSLLMAAIFVPHVCLSFWSTSLSPSCCVRLFLPYSHLATNALFQTEWRQIIPHWHRCVSVIIIWSYTDHRLLFLASPVTNDQLISLIQITCTVCGLEKDIFSNLKSM